MHIVDYAQESANSVDRLRSTMASPAANSSVATDLSISMSSSATSVKPTPVHRLQKFDFLPHQLSYSASARAGAAAASTLKADQRSSSISMKMHITGDHLQDDRDSMTVALHVSPSWLEGSSSTQISPSFTQKYVRDIYLPVAEAISLSPSVSTINHSLRLGKGAEAIVHSTSLQIGKGLDIDMNQVPSSSESDDEEGYEEGRYPRLQLSASTTSYGKPVDGFWSFTGGQSTVKREREKVGSETENTHNSASYPLCEVGSRGSDEEEGNSTRKKLRLSKEQSALLEESFKEYNTLNSKQKSALAKQLNLRPRQVEVWFQNRRARTKLKQTEVDCELLKRCCESLTEENRRLQKEVQELRALKVTAPRVIAHDYYTPIPAATLAMCPSCERLATIEPPPRPSSKQHVSAIPFASLAFNQHHPEPSAAC